MQLNRHLTRATLAALLAAQLAGCGTLFLPERRGQIDGEIDPLIAGLDAAGLIFYIIPGVVALAVDFTTGAIYLPDQRYTLSPQQLDETRNPDGSIDPQRLQQLIEARSGQPLPAPLPDPTRGTHQDLLRLQARAAAY